jgi:hypothetical protein
MVIVLNGNAISDITLIFLLFSDLYGKLKLIRAYAYINQKHPHQGGS